MLRGSDRSVLPSRLGCKSPLRVRPQHPIHRTGNFFFLERHRATISRLRCCRFPVDHHRSNASTPPSGPRHNEWPWWYRISSKAFPKSLQTTSSSIPATACCARSVPPAVPLPHARESLPRWHTRPRSVPVPLSPPPICAPRTVRRTADARATCTPLLALVHLYRFPRNLGKHPPAACPGTRASGLADAHPCDPACRRTIPPAASGLPTADHPARRSTIVPFWFFHDLALTRAPVCRRYAVSSRSSRDVATPPPKAPVIDCIPPPTPPWSSGPAPLRRAHRSPPGDTAVNDPHISRPTHGLTVQDPRSRARSDGSVLPPARSCRSVHKPASPEPAGSL